MTEIAAAVVGTGFIGVVHVEALRRLGIPVLGVVGSSVERARAKADALGLHVYTSLDEMLADPRVTVVHITTPITCTSRRSKRQSPPASTWSAKSPWR